MNKRIIKKRVKTLIRERDLPMIIVYPPLEQFLDLASTAKWLSGYHKTPSRKNLKRFWSYRTKRFKNGYNYDKYTYHYISKERNVKRNKEREFKKWLKKEGLLE